MNPIRAGLAQTPEAAEHTSTYARMQDRQAGDPSFPSSGWLSPVHVDGDGYDGVGARRRPSNKGFLEISFVEQLELLDNLVRREPNPRVRLPQIFARRWSVSSVHFFRSFAASGAAGARGA